MGRAVGLSERDITDIARYETSDTYSELDRLVLDLATAMTRTPAAVPDELRAALVRHLSRGALAELAATIAWENHRARLNRALDVRPAGFSDGAVCAIPAHRSGGARRRNSEPEGAGQYPTAGSSP